MKGLFDYTTMPQVDFHCVPSANINLSSANTYNSTLVGTGFIRNLVFQNALNGTNPNGYLFNTYVNDIQTITLNGKVSTATNTTITIVDTTNNFSNTNNAYYGAKLTITGGTDSLLVSGVNESAKIITNYWQQQNIYIEFSILCHTR